MKLTSFIFPATLAAALALAACGSSVPEAGSGPSTPKTTLSSPAPRAAQAAVETSTNAGSQVSGMAPSGTASAASGSGLPQLPPVDRMIIKNGALTISVEDTDGALGQMDQVVQAAQGIIISQTVRNGKEGASATMVIQVPPQNFETTLARLRDLRAKGSRPLIDTVSSQDVTPQYVDLQAQFNNLQRTRDAYQTLLGKATSIADIIALTREITAIQTQMDQIQARENLLTKQSAVSTITLTIQPLGAASAGPSTLPAPAEAAQQAWSALLTGLHGLAVVLIWMGILLPLPALVVGAGWLVFRRLRASAHPLA